MVTLSSVELTSLLQLDTAQTPMNPAADLTTVDLDSSVCENIRLENYHTRFVHVSMVWSKLVNYTQRRAPSILYGSLQSGPVHTYPDIFDSATFSFRIQLPSTRIKRVRPRIRIFFNPLSREEKKIRNEPDVWTVNPDILGSNDVAKSCPDSYRTINKYDGITCRPSFSRVDPGYHRMRVDRRIRFEYDICGRGSFESGKKRSGLQKFPGTCGRSLVVKQSVQTKRKSANQRPRRTDPQGFKFKSV